MEELPLAERRKEKKLSQLSVESKEAQPKTTGHDRLLTAKKVALNAAHRARGTHESKAMLVKLALKDALSQGPRRWGMCHKRPGQTISRKSLYRPSHESGLRGAANAQEGQHGRSRKDGKGDVGSQWDTVRRRTPHLGLGGAPSSPGLSLGAATSERLPRVFDYSSRPLILLSIARRCRSWRSSRMGDGMAVGCGLAVSHHPQLARSLRSTVARESPPSAPRFHPLLIILTEPVQFGGSRALLQPEQAVCSAAV